MRTFGHIQLRECPVKVSREIAEVSLAGEATGKGVDP
jgi:hypothetical protein